MLLLLPLTLLATASAQLTSFLLTTSSSPTPTTNQTATSLFDPYHQPDFYLRLIGPGYNSLPRFNLSNGHIVTPARRFTEAPQEYGNVGISEGRELVFHPSSSVVGAGTLTLGEGGLVAVGGDVDGWTVCTGVLGRDVIFWKGGDASCVKVYLHAVMDAPY